MPYRFKIIAGGYEVRHAESGVLMGSVRKKVERFNLRRPTTVTTWSARDLSGATIKDGGGQVTAAYRTRNDAAKALAKRF